MSFPVSATMAKYRSSCVLYFCLVFFLDWNVGLDVEVIIEPVGEPVWFMEGHPMNLTCIIKNAAASASKPEWWNEMFEIEEKYVTEKTLSDGTVILQFYKTYFAIEDTGMYRCVAGNSDRMTRVEIFSVVSRDVNLTLGFATSISCDVEPIYEKKSTQWLKGQVPVHEIDYLEDRLTLSGANKTLTILSTKRLDSGQYTCIIKFNPGTEMEQTFSQQVGIFGKPYLTRIGQNGDLIDVTNTTITLKCPVAGHPSPEVFWLHNDDVIEASARYELESWNDVPSTKLVIKKPVDKDHSTYICTAENNLGKTQMSFALPENGNGSNSIHTSILWPIYLMLLSITILKAEIQ